MPFCWFKLQLKLAFHTVISSVSIHRDIHVAPYSCCASTDQPALPGKVLLLNTVLMRKQVMKMIMPLMSPAAGRIRYELLPGAVMKPGDLIGTLELDDPASVTKAQPFEEGFPELGPPLVLSTSISELFKQALTGAQMILAGKCHVCPM